MARCHCIAPSLLSPWQLKNLRQALAIATILNRTLVRHPSATRRPWDLLWLMTRDV